MSDLPVYKFSRIEAAVARLSDAVKSVEQAADVPNRSANDVDRGVVAERDALRDALSQLSTRLGTLIDKVEKG